jgi:hypothetical protein
MLFSRNTPSRLNTESTLFAERRWYARKAIRNTETAMSSRRNARNQSPTSPEPNACTDETMPERVR